MAARAQRRGFAGRAARGRRKARTPRRVPGWAITLVLVLLLGVAKYFGLPAQVNDAVLGAPERFDIAGTARISDGDTLRIGDRRIRLNAIDAPEKAQTCTAASGAGVACGTLATGELTRLIAGGKVSCAAEGEDKYGRMLATCYAAGAGGDGNLNRAMVQAGWAVAYRRYSDRYVLDETGARLAGRGLWALTFETPEDWRHTAAR